MASPDDPEAWGDLLLDGIPGVGLLDDLQLECGLGLPPGLDDLGLDLSDGAIVGGAAASAGSHPTSSDLLESLQLDAGAFGGPSTGTPSGSGSDSPVVLPLVRGAAAPPSASPLRSSVGGLGHDRASPATSESEAHEGDAGGRRGTSGAASGQPGSRQQLSEEEKRLARMQRNRENAQLSRQRKKQQLSDLEARCGLLTRHNAQLTGAVQRLTAENAALRQQLALVCQQAGRNAAAATAAATAKTAAAPAKPAAATAAAAARPAGAAAPAAARPSAAKPGAMPAAPAAKAAATPATPAAAGAAAATQAVTMTATPSATSAAAAAVAARGLLPFPLLPFAGLLPKAFPGQQQQKQQQPKRPAPAAAPAAPPAAAKPAAAPAPPAGSRAPKRARTAAGASTAFLALFSLFMFAGPFSPAPLTTTTAPGAALAGAAGAQRTLQALPDGAGAAAAADLALPGDGGLHRAGRGLQALPAATSDRLLPQQRPAAFDAGGGGAGAGGSHMQRLLNSTLQALLLEPGNAQLEAAALQRLQELGPVALLLDADAPGAPPGANPLAASVAFPQLADQLFGSAGLEVPQMCQKVLEFDAASVPHAARSRRSLERYVLGATGFRGRSLGGGRAGVGAALPPAQGGEASAGAAAHAAPGDGTVRIEEEPAGAEDADGELEGGSLGASSGLLAARGAADGPLLVSVLLPANASGGGNASAPGAAKLAAIDKVFVVLLHPAERYVTYSCALPRAVVL